ncbi:unnamed protein product [Owenia fusiformis]|uniref:Uncharacterized protein n=1 Tax=Owenia fusiformis TaxID=6347 RepID=A0A8J1UXK4_OWEFU|nr:unnamed protein product [Owenia fusiformis]
MKMQVIQMMVLIGCGVALVDATDCRYPCVRKLGTRVADCIDPCGQEPQPECPACPDAVCQKNDCDVCSYYFKFGRSKICDCGIVDCADLDKVTCDEDPCSGVDTSDGVICLSNNCGGCNKVCYQNCRRLYSCPMLNNIE